MLNAPCKDCDNRNIGCHGHCKKYQDYAVENKKLSDFRKKNNQTDYDYFEVRKVHLKRGNRI